MTIGTSPASQGDQEENRLDIQKYNNEYPGFSYISITAETYP